jgi:hypothetical protein
MPDFRVKCNNVQVVFAVLILSGNTYGQTLNFTTVTYNISGAGISWNASTVQARLSNVSSISVNATSSIAVAVESCPTGTYSLVNSQTCTACPQGTYSSTPQASSPNACWACEAGKYSSSTGASSNGTCLSCPSNTFFSGTGGVNISVCVSCPANAWSYEASKLREACICMPGYSGANGTRLCAVFRDQILAVTCSVVRRRCVQPMQRFGMVHVRAGQPLSHELELKFTGLKAGPMLLPTRILRGYYHVKYALPHALPGESREKS